MREMDPLLPKVSYPLLSPIFSSTLPTATATSENILLCSSLFLNSTCSLVSWVGREREEGNEEEREREGKKAMRRKGKGKGKEERQ